MRTLRDLFCSVQFFMALASLLPTVSSLHAAQLARPDSVEYDVCFGSKRKGRMSLSFAELPGVSGPLLRSRLSLNAGFRTWFVRKIPVELWEETLRSEDGGYSFVRRSKVWHHVVTHVGTYDGNRLVCDTESDGKHLHQEIGDSLFDCTSLGSSMDSPEVDLPLGEERTFRILDWDVDSLKVRKLTIRYLRDEDLWCVGSDTVKCKVIRYAFGGQKGLHWITRDRYGVMLKQETDDWRVASFRPVALLWNKAGNH